MAATFRISSILEDATGDAPGGTKQRCPRVSRHQVKVREERTIAPHTSHDLEDHEWPDPSDWTPEDASVDEIACPACGEAVYEGTEKCPECGEWITTHIPSRSWAWAVLAVLVIVSFVMWAIR